MTKRISKLAMAVVVGLTVPTISVSNVHANKAKDNCPQWKKLALDVGFSRRDWVKLDKIIWRESRCMPKAINENSRLDGSTWSRDWGLTQVNDYSWITYLRGKKIVTKSTELLNPRNNLEAAYELYKYSDDRHDDPWLQWKTN
jgi:hypothetical protein